MRQLFFISPTGYPAVRKAFEDRPVAGARTHGWCADGDDASKDQVIGVVEMNGNCDAERVIDSLEAQGIMWLPNHTTNTPLQPEHVAALAKHGVQTGHTTTQAMTLVHGKAGFPPIKPRRF